MAVPGVLLNKTVIADAIRANKGIIKRAADSLEIHKDTIYEWMKREPEIAQAVIDARNIAEIDRDDRDENHKELAYDALEWLLKKRNVTSTLTTLEKLCKKWGRQQETGPTSFTINLNKWSKNTSGSEIDKDD